MGANMAKRCRAKIMPSPTARTVAEALSGEPD
jgi:hypothetical protein